MYIIQIIMLVIGCFSIPLYFSSYILLTKNWECTQAIIVDKDPSNTECTVYMRKTIKDKVE